MIFKKKPADFKSKFDVVSCFLEHDGKFLLVHRTDHKPEGGLWGVPAGKVDPGETPLQAIVRELREETGCTTTEKNLLYFGKVYVRWPSMDFVYHIFHLAVEYRPRLILNLEEHKAFDWLTGAEALRLNLVPDQSECIKLFYKLP